MEDRTPEIDLRLFTWDDLPALVAIANRSAEADGDDERYTSDSLREELEAHNDPLADCFIAELGGVPVGYAHVEVRDDEDRVWGFGWGTIDPPYRRRGIGTQLVRAADLRFIERAAAEAGPDQAIFIQRYTKSSAEGEGPLALQEWYSELRSSYRMRATLDHPLEPADPPEGFAFRPFERARDARAVYEVDQAAFMDGGGQVLRTPFETWQQQNLDANEFDPALWIVAVSDGTHGPVGEIAGIAYTVSFSVEQPELAWINHVGVLRHYRRHGLGGALIRQSLYVSQQRGFALAALGVRADNPDALGIYERAGLAIYCHYVHYRKVLRGDPSAIKS